MLVDPFAGRVFGPGDDPTSPALMVAFGALLAAQAIVLVLPCTVIATRMGRPAWTALSAVHPWGLLLFLYFQAFWPRRSAEVMR